ncbi:hypothetical protein HPB47_012287 [Ixodes persulcatus]|uniref:Uncharacterized protein n=1 Tax=Ixodes persulcatus TaxID=34615 RepID=A0AC60NTX9_IXOPE|nr:hypothetical protein HPB47_012287 [Ixodes persulcatus]
MPKERPTTETSKGTDLPFFFFTTAPERPAGGDGRRARVLSAPQTSRYVSPSAASFQDSSNAQIGGRRAANTTQLCGGCRVPDGELPGWAECNWETDDGLGLVEGAASPGLLRGCGFNGCVDCRLLQGLGQTRAKRHWYWWDVTCGILCELYGSACSGYIHCWIKEYVDAEC